MTSSDALNTVPDFRTWLLSGSILCGLAVALGAFAAHGLDARFAQQYAEQTKLLAGEPIPASQKYLNDFKTAAEYQMLHGLALIALSSICHRLSHNMVRAIGGSFLAGILLFSGSLYILTLSGVRAWGAVTPIGGLFFLLGWLLLAIAAVKTQNQS